MELRGEVVWANGGIGEDVGGCPMLRLSREVTSRSSIVPANGDEMARNKSSTTTPKQSTLTSGIEGPCPCRHATKQMLIEAQSYLD